MMQLAYTFQTVAGKWRVKGVIFQKAHNEKLQRNQASWNLGVQQTTPDPEGEEVKSIIALTS